MTISWGEGVQMNQYFRGEYFCLETCAPHITVSESPSPNTLHPSLLLVTSLTILQFPSNELLNVEKRELMERVIKLFVPFLSPSC